MLVVVLETGGNLGPETLKLLLVLTVVCLIRLDPVRHVIAICSGIVVNVENAVHTVVDDVIYDFLYSVHPGFIHRTVFLHVLEPGYGYANRIEAVLLQKIYHCLGGRYLSPCFLKVGYGVALHVHPHGYGIHTVTEVGTDTHVSDGIHCAFLYIGRVEVYLVAGDDILAAECVLPPVVGWHVVAIPRHKPAPFGTSVPCLINAGCSRVVIDVSTTFSQSNELARIASLNLLELLCLLSSIKAIEVATDDIYILIAGIPVGIIVIGIGIAIVILCSPSPNQVVDALALEVLEHGLPQLLVSFSTIISPPEP